MILYCVGLSHESLGVTRLGPYAPPQLWWQPINNPRFLTPPRGGVSVLWDLKVSGSFPKEGKSTCPFSAGALEDVNLPESPFIYLQGWKSVFGVWDCLLIKRESPAIYTVANSVNTRLGFILQLVQKVLLLFTNLPGGFCVVLLLPSPAFSLSHQ